MLHRAVAALFALLLALPSAAQIPPSAGIVIGSTPVQGGTATQCLYVTSGGRVGNQLCSTGSVTTFSAASTGLTPNSATAGAITLGGILVGANGGTGVANTGKTITLEGNFTTSGAFATTLTVSGATNVTLPTTGTLATLAGAETLTTKTLTAPIITSTAWASVPAAGTAGRIAHASDFGTKGALLMDDGTRWKPVAGCAVLATLDTASANIANSETVVFQYQMPANILQTNDRLRLRYTMTKSGATDSGTSRVRVGTLGTTGDTLIMNNNPFLAAANRSGAMVQDFRLESATSLRLLGNNAASGAAMGYSAVSNNAAGAAVTIASAAANALFVSLTILSSGATDTVAIVDAALDLCASAN